MNDNLIRTKFNTITDLLMVKGLTITTMESCTGGLIASLLTDIEGSSAVIKGAFVTYSNEAKIMEGVPQKTIEKYGVYSHETADAMAIACKKSFGADIGIGVTGTMGNADPANEDSSLGQIFYTIAYKNECYSKETIILPQKSRYDYKLEVADIIADSLSMIIQEKF
jgi:PncC family amidohydrolase